MRSHQALFRNRVVARLLDANLQRDPPQACAGNGRLAGPPLMMCAAAWVKHARNLRLVTELSSAFKRAGRTWVRIKSWMSFRGSRPETAAWMTSLEAASTPKECTSSKDNLVRARR